MLQNSLTDLVFVEEMSKFKSPGYWIFWSFVILLDFLSVGEAHADLFLAGEAEP